MNSAHSSFEYIFKVLLVGNSGSGKSSVLKRFVENEFDNEITTTIGADFAAKIVSSNGIVAKLSIWDTAGQERFRSLSASYYRGCHGVVLVFDVNSKASFTSIKQWLEEIELYTERQYMALLMVGNKIDLKEREVSTEEAQQFATNEAMLYIETSALTNVNIANSFNLLYMRILESPRLMQLASLHNTVSVATPLEQEQKLCGAC